MAQINFNSKERIFEGLAINYYHDSKKHNIIVTALNLLEFIDYMHLSYEANGYILSLTKTGREDILNLLQSTV